jgi:uncharacterized protein (TIGR02145 family)
MKKQLLILFAMCAFVAAQAQEVYNVYCTQSITLQPEGGELGTNAEWKWYTGSCGGSLAYEGASYTISPTASATYYVRAEGSCGTTTCRYVIVNVTIPSFTVAPSANRAAEGYNITFTGTGFPAGGTIQWSAANAISGTAATAMISSTSTNGVVSAQDARPVLRATATYTVAAGAGCSATSNNYTILAACPYAQTDLVVGSCYLAPTGAQNWRATINDSRVSGTLTLNAAEGKKYYNIVQMPDNRWWFAENVNFRKDLTFQGSSDIPFTNDANGGVPGIGYYWCPAGTGASLTTTNADGCNLWGALYTWEAAMMVDGKYSNDSKADNTWVEPTDSYCTYTTDAYACTQNAGRGSTKQGICPTGWHVPTDAEMVTMLNQVETGEKNHETSIDFLGTYAGMQLKSQQTCPTNNSNCVGDDKANWRYTTVAPSGRDSWGFNALPAGGRYRDGRNFYNRGTYAYFWNSTPFDGQNAWHKDLGYSLSQVRRTYFNRAYGYSVRCLRD